MRHLTLMAQGVIEVIRHLPFTMCVSSLGERPVYLLKYNTLNVALPSPAKIMTTSLAAPGVAGVMKRGENGSKGGSSTDSEKTRQDEVRVGLDDESVRREVQQLLEVFQNNWRGRLENTDAAEHRIELNLGTKLIYRAPDRAGQRSREAGKAEPNPMRERRRY